MKKIFPHVFVFFAFIALIYLGTWQVMRREEKNELVAKIDSNVNAPLLSPDSYKNIGEDEFRKMALTGAYMHDKEFLLLNKPYNGKPGQHVMTPFKATNGDVIIVDRGWIPTDKEYEKPTGQIQITGVVRATQKLNGLGKMITFNNDPQKQIWFWLDLPLIYKTYGLPKKDYYLDLVNETKSNSYPVALPAKIDVYNEHLIYVITWYSIAIVLLLVYYFRFWKK